MFVAGVENSHGLSMVTVMAMAVLTPITVAGWVGERTQEVNV